MKLLFFYGAAAAAIGDNDSRRRIMSITTMAQKAEEGRLRATTTSILAAHAITASEDERVMFHDGDYQDIIEEELHDDEDSRNLGSLSSLVLPDHMSSCTSNADCSSGCCNFVVNITGSGGGGLKCDYHNQCDFSLDIEERPPPSGDDYSFTTCTVDADCDSMCCKSRIQTTEYGIGDYICSPTSICTNIRSANDPGLDYEFILGLLVFGFLITGIVYGCYKKCCHKS